MPPQPRGTWQPALVMRRRPGRAPESHLAAGPGGRLVRAPVGSRRERRYLVRRSRTEAAMSTTALRPSDLAVVLALLERERTGGETPVPSPAPPAGGVVVPVR